MTLAERVAARLRERADRLVGELTRAGHPAPESMAEEDRAVATLVESTLSMHDDHCDGDIAGRRCRCEYDGQHDAVQALAVALGIKEAE